MKPRWEQLVRLHILHAPRHSSANDSASILLILCGAAVLCGTVVGVLCRPLLRWPVTAFMSIFCGLSLQQYSHYTVFCFVECWDQEAPAVIGIVVVASALMSFISLLASVLLSPLLSLGFNGILCTAMLHSFRWAPWASLFDGSDKLRTQRAR